MISPKDVLLDHYKKPRNYGIIQQKEAIVSEADNPSCGDAIKISLLVSNSIVVRVGFVSHGCVLSKAAASLFSVWATGKEIQALVDADEETMCKLVKINIGPNRMQCVLLALQAAKKVISSLV